MLPPPPRSPPRPLLMPRPRPPLPPLPTPLPLPLPGRHRCHFHSRPTWPAWAQSCRRRRGEVRRCGCPRPVPRPVHSVATSIAAPSKVSEPGLPDARHHRAPPAAVFHGRRSHLMGTHCTDRTLQGNLRRVCSSPCVCSRPPSPPLLPVAVSVVSVPVLGTRRLLLLLLLLLRWRPPLLLSPPLLLYRRPLLCKVRPRGVRTAAPLPLIRLSLFPTHCPRLSSSRAARSSPNEARRGHRPRRQ